MPRTNQQMPHYFQFYTSFKENEDLLNIKIAAEELSIPYLIVHGELDETVPIKEAENLHAWCPTSQIEIISGANHSFEVHNHGQNRYYQLIYQRFLSNL